MSKAIKTLKALKNVRLPEVQSAPPMETESPGRKLARLTAEHAKTVEELQTLKRKFAQRNLKAQHLRQAVSTPEITAFETRRKDLAQRILHLNTEIGTTNRAIREHRAERMSGKRVQEPAELAIVERTANGGRAMIFTNEELGLLRLALSPDVSAEEAYDSGCKFFLALRDRGVREMS
jgi:hypothetical protein